MKHNYFEPRNYSNVGSDYARLGIEKNQCTLTGESIQERKSKIREEKNMEIKVKAHKVINDGMHEGVITGVNYRESPMAYTDYVIKSEEVEIKASYPTNITPDTMHGKMLTRFGLQVVEDLMVNPDKLIGIRCAFTTVNHTTLKGTFPEVMRDTLKPLPVQPADPVGTTQ